MTLGSISSEDMLGFQPHYRLCTSNGSFAWRKAPLTIPGDRIQLKIRHRVASLIYSMNGDSGVWLDYFNAR